MITKLTKDIDILKTRKYFSDQYIIQQTNNSVEFKNPVYNHSVYIFKNKVNALVFRKNIPENYIAVFVDFDLVHKLIPKVVRYEYFDEITVSKTRYERGHSDYFGIKYAVFVISKLEQFEGFCDIFRDRGRHVYDAKRISLTLIDKDRKHKTILKSGPIYRNLNLRHKSQKFINFTFNICECKISRNISPKIFKISWEKATYKCIKLLVINTINITDITTIIIKYL